MRNQLMQMKASSAESLMRLICPINRRIHNNWYFYGKFWVESRYCNHRGWFSILWPWPRRDWLNRFSEKRDVYRQIDAGRTLPVFCETEADAVEWAWQLAWIKELNKAA